MKYSAIIPFFALAIFASIGCDSGNSKAGETNDDATTTVTNIDAITASQLLSSKPEMVVLDVRTPQEFATGHIPAKVVNIDFKDAEFKTKVAELDRETPYLVHCQGGGRSTSSLDALKELGFKHIYHLDGGLSAWQDAGEAVEK